MYEGFIAETTKIVGHGGDVIDCYFARPLGAGPFPAVTVNHHMPGWDEGTRGICHKLAHHGYIAIMPNLHHRVGPGTPDDQAAAVRAGGGQSDEVYLGDLDGALHVIELQQNWNGNVGNIGFCSGGRQAFLAACKRPQLAAAVDCWGGRVIAAPEELTPRQPVAPIEYVSEMTVPLLGIFGNDDQAPSPEQVNQTEEILKNHGKVYEFHRYDGAGHGFFAVDRAGYRPVQATDAWTKVFAWFEKYLQSEVSERSLTRV